MVIVQEAWNWLWQTAREYPAVGLLLKLVAVAGAPLVLALVWVFLSRVATDLRTRSGRLRNGAVGPTDRPNERSESKHLFTNPVLCGALVMALGALGASEAIRDFFPSAKPYYFSPNPKRRVEPELRLLAFGGLFALGLLVAVRGRRSR